MTSMNVYWLEQTEADLPSDNEWLGVDETVRLSAMRFPKRRDDWRLGRWVAKRALSLTMDLPTHPRILKKTMKRIEIRAAPSGAPEVFFDEQPAAVTISLSHRAGIAACAVAMSRVAVGCDLEMAEPRSAAFVADYFTLEEQALIAHAPAADQPRLVALLWSGKESALKALREGLRLDTRTVIVIPCSASLDLKGWSELRVRYTGERSAANRSATDRSTADRATGDRLAEDRYAGDRIFHGWWQHSDGMVRTIVAAPPPDPPIRLRIPVHFLDVASLCA
jgi:4'-phosphopantetheinyl transferase